MARHRGTCGVEVMRKRKRCQYCGKDLTESYIKKHAIVCKKKQEETVVDRQAPQGAEMAKIQDNDDDASLWLETSTWWRAGTERQLPLS